MEDKMSMLKKANIMYVNKREIKDKYVYTLFCIKLTR